MVQKRQLAEEEYDVSHKHLKLEHSGDALVPSLQFTKEVITLQSDKDESCFFKPVIGFDYGFLSTNHPICTMKNADDTLSTSSLASSITSEEDARTLILHEDTYSLQNPTKEIPIGPKYQAEIPEWCGSTYENNKFMGSTVIPMPEDPTIHNEDTIGRGRSDCCCKIPGCVQKHIKEKREILKESIGHERLGELGFGNMGEEVAQNWTEEEEELFHEVVYTNPVSLGRNFWNHLAEAFPSRTNQEIVSYYFNVFVLRRRAEQNRCDPMNVDSDDDEWQGNDDGSEEEEDYSCHVYYSYDQMESESRSSFDPTSRTMVDNEVQYDSCTSLEVNHVKSYEFMFENSVDSKVWDVGYLSYSRIKTDFLPTGSMIESWDFDDDKTSN